MSIITGVIPPQAFEVIRDRVGEILADELANQFTLTANASLNPPVEVERYRAVDATELPLLVVNVARGSYDNKHAITSDGTYLYNIDGYVRGASSSGQDGDNLASITLQRILGICRAILENPGYKTLGFAPPFIERVFVQEIGIAEPERTDKENIMMGRLTLLVRVPEDVELITPVDLDVFSTQVKLEETEKGYIFTGPDIP